MAEEKKVTVDEIEYAESELSKEAKVWINHVSSLEQKIKSASFNMLQLQGGREFFLAKLRAELEVTE